ncbi:hypothetical protein J1N35_021573 [Gossypium stocksii]|uniref:Protein kinase domain-containing protein n=1 Tax=Gossypium stocksii TaxID=47602 RepID=A0A9D3VFZ3_9ROSI|nr:hypothetical protein J1N35_021573 [Gossypium stocksii]
MKNPLGSLLSFLGLKKNSPRLELPEGLGCRFSLAQIKAATNNFDSLSIIGRGGSGTVYKGTLHDGTIVAVKRLRESYQGGEFKNEGQLLCQLCHPNLVSLIGFCVEGSEMVFVLEYMSRGSLAVFLFGIREDYLPLSWKHRLHICIGAARGLHYLHTGAKHAVIHRDIKSSNILLDEGWCCKLSDFGLSYLGPPSMSKALIRKDKFNVVGTFGYIAPEYAMNGELTDKSDVYSFGVVLFEVLYGRRISDQTLIDNQRTLLTWAKESLREGTIHHAIDPYLKGRIAPECLNKFLEIASSCVHCKGNERPAMGEVEVTLELALELQERADSEMESIYPSVSFVVPSNLLRFEEKSPQLQGSELPEDICRQFSLAEIEAATNNFHPGSIIGIGRYGSIYKGTIDDGTVVAVSRRRSSLGAVRELQNEVRLLCQLRHPHLVFLIGFCLVENELFVVLIFSLGLGRITFHCLGNIGYTYVSVQHVDYITCTAVPSML